MVIGSLLIVGPILHGPVTTDLSYEYEVEEVPSDELPRSVAHQAPNVRECFTDFEARGCTLEHMVDAEDLVMDVDEFEEDIDAGTRESDTIYMLGDGMVRPVTTHDGNGTVTLTHEPVTEEEFIEESVVSEGRIDSDDAAVESIELGQTVTDEPIEVWEAYRIVE
ncbi:hypothetical protein HALLA_07030 [Halostagnicola larsenii XH-48]|uniref:Uncharacterized protein n=2 Tax=Halostagnicola larsenii TaxID=353800 RepID=W0JQ01_9EURY|nr:hypothetical protein HALLA_07030 [Halostagnicola larsenii XH-48]